MSAWSMSRMQQFMQQMKSRTESTPDDTAIQSKLLDICTAEARSTSLGGRDNRACCIGGSER